YGDPSRVLTNAIGPVETEDGPGGVGPGGVGSGAGDMAEGWGSGALRSGSSPHAATEMPRQQTSARYFMTPLKRAMFGSPDEPDARSRRFDVPLGSRSWGSLH